MCARSTRWLAILAALSTLALMVSAARPWGGNYAYQGWWGYARLLLLMAWATLPYLVILFLAGRAVPAKSGKIIFLIGTLIITGGGWPPMLTPSGSTPIRREGWPLWQFLCIS